MEPREYCVVRGLGIVGHFKWDNIQVNLSCSLQGEMVLQGPGGRVFQANGSTYEWGQCISALVWEQWNQQGQSRKNTGELPGKMSHRKRSKECCQQGRAHRILGGYLKDLTFPWIKWEVIGVGLRVDMTSLRNPDSLCDTDHRMEMLSGCAVQRNDVHCGSYLPFSAQSI